MSSGKGRPESHIPRQSIGQHSAVLRVIRNVRDFISDGKDPDRLLHDPKSNPAERCA